MSEQYMVLVGNAFTGVTGYGPFNSDQEANDWAVDEESATAPRGVIADEPWVVGVLNSP
jgi:hypothetical protein